MSYKYYDDLSDHSDHCDDDDDDDDDGDAGDDEFDVSLMKNSHHIIPNKNHNIIKNNNSIYDSKSVYSENNHHDDRYHDKKNVINNNNNNRIIIHLDIDCFYCQCEVIDRKLDPNIPLAIQQKHIIVTCNYPARKQLGLTKLMLMNQVLKVKDKYPNLIIVNGSDLEKYRQYGYTIYQCFRNTIRKYCHNNDCSISKGSMDEMSADITSYVMNQQQQSYGSRHISDDNNQQEEENNNNNFMKDDVYIYGQSKNEITTITEDQSGATTTSIHTMNQKQEYKSNSYLNYHDNDNHSRFMIASKLAFDIRQTIINETGFTTTIGISINPLLSKIASGLRKPATVNIILPNTYQHLIYSMPLRKIPGIGYSTMKSFISNLNLDNHNNDYQVVSNEKNKNDKVWTCGDLLKLPRIAVLESLRQIKSIKESDLDEQCDIILKKCQGIENSVIIDDDGSLSKTLSVENSFRRGSMTNQNDIVNSMEISYSRLSRLISQRILQCKKKSLVSSNSSSAATTTTCTKIDYPKTMKITIRFVIYDISKENINTKDRLPTITRSQQISWDGQKLMNEIDMIKQIQYLRQGATPMIRSLILSSKNITKHLDITRINIALTNFVSETKPFISSNTSTKTVIDHTCTSQHKTPCRLNLHNTQATSNQLKIKSSNNILNEYDSTFIPRFDQIDPNVLSELPPDIMNEVMECVNRRHNNEKHGIVRQQKKNTTKRLKTMHDYFVPSTTTPKKKG